MFLFRIYWYSTAATDTAAYIIGGSAGGTWESTIAEFKNNKWRKFGDLTTARNSHSSISFGGETIILGGDVWNRK